MKSGQVLVFTWMGAIGELHIVPCQVLNVFQIQSLAMMSVVIKTKVPPAITRVTTDGY
jgi:hypothetical protein